MTALERVARTRQVLAAAAVTAALGWGAAASLTAMTIITSTSALAKSPSPTWGSEVVASVVIGVITAVTLLWRRRQVASSSRVALWIEESLPQLHYALVSAVEPELTADRQSLEAAVANEDISGVTNRALRRSVVPALTALFVAVALLYVSSAFTFSRGAVRGGFGGNGRAGALSAENRLNDLRAEVTPPAYAQQQSRSIDDPTSVRALVGSTITVTGAGSSGGITARIGTVPASVNGSGSSWRTRFTMPSRPAALSLTARSFERVVVLEPQTDESPKVTLLLPVRDTTVRAVRLIVQLSAEATDDVGLTTGYFEYLITSGSGEIFTGRTITTPPVQFRNARRGAIDATLSLAALKLSQGDVVSVRAIARDGNTLSGPSIGTSETRTFRVARADEYDSVSIEAAASPPVDSSAMSQRMLVLMTEALVKKEKSLSRAEYVKQATDIGSMEDRIRKRVYDILYQTESQDAPSDSEEVESELEAITNKDLKEAYDALWTAVRSLQIAEPRPALPPMRIALAALDRARLAQRLYLRGNPPRIIVDLQRVRLTGKEKGASSVRTPRSISDSTRVRLSARFNETLDLVAKQPARAMTEMALMRVDALSSLPDFAAALGQAIEAIRSGRDATLPLLRARRALEGTPRATPGLPAWWGGGGGA